MRERAVADRVQRALERLYQLDRVADVDAFLEEAASGEREALLVREADDGAIEMALRVPRLGPRTLDLTRGADLDPLCQIIEGVSHFVYLADRARVDREATQLELELQAEVDKFVVLAAWLGEPDVRASATLASATLRRRRVRARSLERARSSLPASPTIARTRSCGGWSATTSKRAAGRRCAPRFAPSTAWARKRSCASPARPDQPV